MLKKIRNLEKKIIIIYFQVLILLPGVVKMLLLFITELQRKKKKKINRNDIFLCDSGGQYKYGTTDVTRTICFSKPSNYIKNIFTRVLKGHIAVVEANLKSILMGN